MSESNMLIPGRHIQLLDTVGQGIATLKAHTHRICLLLQVNLESCIEVTFQDGRTGLQLNWWL